MKSNSVFGYRCNAIVIRVEFGAVARRNRILSNSFSINSPASAHRTPSEICSRYHFLPLDEEARNLQCTCLAETFSPS